MVDTPKGIMSPMPALNPFVRIEGQNLTLGRFWRPWKQMRLVCESPWHIQETYKVPENVIPLETLLPLSPRNEGIEKYKLLVTSHGDVKYSIANIVNTIVITMYGARCVVEISGGTFCKVYAGLTTMLYTWHQYKIILKGNCNWKIKK